MSQPTTFLVDPVPNEQAWPWAMPIYWTSNRTYCFNQQITNTVPDKALFYKSLDDGQTWTQPDVANSLVCNGECDYFFDGVTKTVNIVVAPASFARRSTSTWVAGVIVAQLTKIFPCAPVSNESPLSANTASCAASSRFN